MGERTDLPASFRGLRVQDVYYQLYRNGRTKLLAYVFAWPTIPFKLYTIISNFHEPRKTHPRWQTFQTTLNNSTSNAGHVLSPSQSTVRLVHLFPTGYVRSAESALGSRSSDPPQSDRNKLLVDTSNLYFLPV
jgi:hypothetical protein